VPFERTDGKVVRIALPLRPANRAYREAQRARMLEVRVVRIEEGKLIFIHDTYYGPRQRNFRFAPIAQSFALNHARKKNMQPYRNLAGNSGVEAFDILRTGIVVRFVNGSTYLYDYHVPGRTQVEEMMRLARAGRGLSTYISKLGAEYAKRFD
jgi:hypothetical protein